MNWKIGKKKFVYKATKRDKMIEYTREVTRHGIQKRSSICLTGVPKGEERENSEEARVEGITTQVSRT